jgi:hypothetical protein
MNRLQSSKGQWSWLTPSRQKSRRIRSDAAIAGF